ncbi:MAG: hypothetical protein Q8M02_01130 [Candidatus Didemnitutus sp.]|nr:hypothetical protein [Candidatus Didemnitutus sp.]
MSANIRPWLLPAALGLLAGATALLTVHYYRAATAATERAHLLERQMAELRFEFEKVRTRNEQLTARATELDVQLGSAKLRATAHETKSALLNRELASAKFTLVSREQREVALMAEIEGMRYEARKAADRVKAAARSAPGVLLAPDPELAAELDYYQKRIATLENQLTAMLTRALAESIAPAAAAEPNPATTALPTRTARESGHRLVRVGTQEAFVVVDYGAEHGASVGQFAVIKRGTAALARVQLSDVRERFSIAQVLPQLRNGQLQAGDIVVIGN